MTQSIRQFGDPVLHRETKDINIATTKESTINVMFGGMKLALEMGRENGIAIAANQVGFNASMFVHRWPDGQYVGIINPRITAYSPHEMAVTEGCLSMPEDFYVRNLKRHSKIWVDYWEWPSKIEYSKRMLTGFEAQMFQHEIDHLKGMTILDRVTCEGEEYVSGTDHR